MSWDDSALLLADIKVEAVPVKSVPKSYVGLIHAADWANIPEIGQPFVCFHYSAAVPRQRWPTHESPNSSFYQHSHLLESPCRLVFYYVLYAGLQGIVCKGYVIILRFRDWACSWANSFNCADSGLVIRSITLAWEGKWFTKQQRLAGGSSSGRKLWRC